MKKSLYILLAVISISCWYACTSPLEGVTLQLPVAVKGSNVVVQFKPDNATAGDLPKDISIKIAGVDSAKVVDIIGGRDFAVKQNILSLAAKPGIVPTEKTPISFTVIAEAPGYLKSITSVSLTSVNDLNLTIELTKIATPPVGVTVVQQPATVSNTGTTTAAVSVVTPANNGITEKATVNIPTGVTMKDEAGTPVAGTVNIVVSKAEAAKTDVSVNANDIDKVVDKNNKPITDFTVKPIVGVDVEITNNSNQKVKSFTGEIEVKTEIPAGSINPETKKEFKVGDLMAITSYDEDTKTYKYEGSATLTLNPAGKLEVSGKVNHLTIFFFSYFYTIKFYVETIPPDPTDLTNRNIAIFGPEIAKAPVVVYKDYFVNLTGKISQYSTESFKFDFEYTDGTHSSTSTSDRTYIRVSTPSEISKISITNELGETITSVKNPSVVNNTITVEIPEAPNFINFVANLSCPEGKTTSADNIQVFAKAPGAADSKYLYIGKAQRQGLAITGTTTLLKRNGFYDFKFVVGNTPFYYPNKQVSSGADFSINSSMPEVLCQ